MPTLVVATPEATALYRGLVVPHLFAILVGTLLSGVVFLQLAFYHSRRTSSPRRRLERTSIAIILVSSVAMLACDWWSMFDLVVTHAAEPVYVMTFHLPDFLRVFFGAIGVGAAQAWFLDRAARIVRKSKVFIGVGSLLLLAELGAAISLTTIGLSTTGQPAFYNTMANLTIAWFWLGAAVDILSTSVLCWGARQLFRRRSETSESPLRNLVRLTFATGFATSLVALAGGIVYLLTRQTTNAFIPFVDALPRLSTFSMLLTVNSQDYWLKSRQAEEADLPPSEKGPQYIIGLPKHGPSSSMAVYSPTLEDRQEYEINFNAFDRSFSTGATSHRGERRRSITAVSAVSNRYGWDAISPRKERSQGVDTAHVSEIGSVGDLERALKFYKREDQDGRGLSPHLETALDPEEQQTPPPSKRHSPRLSFSLPSLRRPCCRKKGCVNGVLVARVVSTEVDEGGSESSPL